MKKSVKISLGILGGIVLIVFIGIFAVLKPAIEYGLHRAGFGNARVETADFSLSGTTLKNVQLDDEANSVGEVKLYATLSDALAGHLSKVDIHDVKLHWPMNLAAAGKSAGALNLFASQVTLTNAVLTVKTPSGDLPVSVSGSIVDHGDTYKADLDVKATADFANLDGKLTGELVKNSRLAKLEFKINEAKITLPDFDVKRATGWVQADIDPAKPLPLPSAQLDFGAVTAYGLPLKGASLKVSAGADKSEFLLTAEVPNDSGDIAVDFTLDRKDKDADKVALRAEAKLRKLDALNLANVKGEGNLLLQLTGSRAKTDDIWDVGGWKDLQGSAGIDMEKLSLPGLLSNAEALATVRLSLDPAAQTVTAQAVDGAMSFNGTFKPVDLAPLSLNIPAEPKNPATILWDQKEKRLKADFTGADFTGLSVMAKQMTAHLAADISATPVLDGTLRVGELSHMAVATSQYFLPVKLDLRFHPLKKDSTVTTMTGAVTEKNGRLSASLKGAHDVAANKGELDIGMPPTTLTQNVTSLATIFPISQHYILDGYGVVGLSGKLAWSRHEGKWDLDSKGQLYLRNFSCTVKGNALNNINTVMDLTSLFPLTLEKQQISVGGVNVGLPLSDGLLNISLASDGTFTVHSASWTLAKGTVTSSPFSVKLPDIATAFTLEADNLDLSDIFAIAPTEGLQATGTVHGTIPVQVNNNSITITNGKLETKGSGTIRYEPTKLPSFLQNAQQQQLIDLKTALTHFDYTALSLTLNGQLGQSQKVVLHVEGNNPLFYSGRPVNFNLNLEGPLENVLRYAPGGSQIPDSIKQELQAYETSHAKL